MLKSDLGFSLKILHNFVHKMPYFKIHKNASTNVTCLLQALAFLLVLIPWGFVSLIAINFFKCFIKVITQNLLSHDIISLDHNFLYSL